MQQNGLNAGEGTKDVLRNCHSQDFFLSKETTKGVTGNKDVSLLGTRTLAA